MPTFRLIMIMRDGRSVLTNIAGCVNADDAKAKAAKVYDGIEKFKSVEPVKVKG